LNPERIEHCIERLPPLSPAALKAMALLERKAVDLTTVAHELDRDPALVARILRLANSPFYGCVSRVATVHKACLVLGTRTLHQVIMAAAVMATLEARFQVDSTRRWRHATATARAARLLAEGRHSDPELVATAALLHDLGRILLGACLADEYHDITAHARAAGVPIREAELEAFGVDHAVIGARVVEKWRLPSALTLAIGRHHTPDDGITDPLVDIVHVANVLAHALDQDDEEEVVPIVSEAAWNRLGLQIEIAENLFPEIAREIG
jgi:putative nucleotidyltransferase with HDIG domain